MPTPSEPRPPHDGPPLEPIRVLRPRRTDALAELMREYHEQTRRTAGGPVPGGHDPGDHEPGGYESVVPPRSSSDPSTRPRPPAGPGGPPRPPAGSEDPTRELPPVAPAYGAGRTASPAVGRRGSAPPGAGRHGADQGPGPRRAAVAVAVVAAALLGFGGALLLRGGGATADEAAPAPGPTASAAAPTPTPSPPAADPDGPGTLREGATGPEVAELQARLLRVPDVYRDGSTSGRYDPALTEAVARFQLWYGIRGDETGVYGDDTRAALESRTEYG
ncbi:peptidoglycan-binding protein [Streptomyces sp. NPDC057838]|uniref:peptidoglycan-binding domain-containing protein n=1 Tax=unclassified Streptomyces TaxID=2593676 RepID=UPI00368D3358